MSSSPFGLAVLQGRRAQGCCQWAYPARPEGSHTGKIPKCPDCLQKPSAKSKNVLQQTETKFKPQVLALSSKLPAFIVPMHPCSILLDKNPLWVSFPCLVLKALKDFCLRQDLSSSFSLFLRPLSDCLCRTPWFKQLLLLLTCQYKIIFIITSSRNTLPCPYVRYQETFS